MAKPTDSSYLEEASMHAVNFKIRSTPQLHAYMAEHGKLAGRLATFFKESIDSDDLDLRELMVRLLDTPAAQAAANIAPWLIKSSHKIRQSFDDVEGKKTPKTRLLKRPALRLRERGILPLDFMSGLQSQAVATQVIFTAVMAVKSWFECDKLAKAAYLSHAAEIARLQQNVDPVMWVNFMTWLTHCEANNYFKLRGRIVHQIEKGKINYCHDEVMAALASLFPEYSKPFKEYTILQHFTNVMLAIRRLDTMKNGARWTAPSEHNSSLCFMSSLPDFTLDWNNTPSIKVKLGSQYTNLDVHKGRYGNGNNMMRNVTIISRKPCYYEITYDRYGRTVNATCKSVFIRRIGGEYFAQLSIGIKNLPPSGMSINDFNLAMRAHKTATTVGYNPQFKVLAVDLGLRHLASYAIIDANGTVTKTGISDGPKNGEQHIKDLRTAINQLRYDIDAAQRDSGISNDISAANSKVTLQAQANSLKAMLQEIKTRGLFNGEPSGLWLTYAAMIRNLRSVLIKLHTSGKEFKLGDRQKPLFPTLLEYYSSFKDNLLNKLVATLTKLARNNNVHVVVLEDLSHFKTSTSRDQNENLMLTLWSHRAIAEAVARGMAIHGIAVGFIDPRHTSQIDPKTGEFGYRQKTNRDKLWVVRDGVVESIEADQAAAQNIGIRFAKRHTDLPYIRSIVCDAGLLPVSSSDGEIGVRVQNAIKTAVGSTHGVLTKHGDRYMLEAITKKRYLSLLSSGSANSVVELFKHGDQYVPRLIHKQLVDNIGQIAGVLDADKLSYIKRYKPKIKNAILTTAC